jgi:hypothetical protein
VKKRQSFVTIWVAVKDIVPTLTMMMVEAVGNDGREVFRSWEIVTTIAARGLFTSNVGESY